MATIEEIIKLAKAEVGYNRYEDPEQGTKYGRWYAELTKSPYFGTTGVPFCAMGVSYVFAKGKTSCIGLPTAGCTSGILKPARNSGKLLKPSNLKRGDVILFDWSGRGYNAPEADHVGIVLYWNNSTNVHTWEANVAGQVKECDRDIKWVVGGVRPAYDPEKTAKDLPLLKKGDKGFAVGVLQRLLILRGVATFTNPDEVFGDKTEASVKSFQKLVAIYPDGMVGAKTWPALTSK